MLPGGYLRGLALRDSPAYFGELDVDFTRLMLPFVFVGSSGLGFSGKYGPSFVTDPPGVDVRPPALINRCFLCLRQTLAAFVDRVSSKLRRSARHYGLYIGEDK